MRETPRKSLITTWLLVLSVQIEERPMEASWKKWHLSWAVRTDETWRDSCEDLSLTLKLPC